VNRDIDEAMYALYRLTDSERRLVEKASDGTAGDQIA
jgi:hypothetical protein